MKSLLYVGAALLAFTPVTFAQEADDNPSVQETIEVTSARQRALSNGMLADTIEQTEIVDYYDLVSSQSVVLSDALGATPGARVNNECSMCGVKRIMLNGLGGQHTTLLVDGLPAHTLVSGFYGPDALAMAGVERIEVARGAGASLTAPEAIGGTVNIVTQDPVATGFRLNLAGGTDGYRQGDAVTTWVSSDGLFRWLGAAQFDTRGQYDGDGNGVSESPYVENFNLSTRLSFDPTDVSTLTVRAGATESTIFGGPVIGDIAIGIDETIESFDDLPSTQLFAGDNVNNRFIGKPWETTEYIATERRELALLYFYELSDTLNLDLGASWSSHAQDSFYEGFDYRADNEMLYLSGRLNWAVDPDHLLTIGVDRRVEDLRSHSDAASGDPAYVSDSFDYVTQSLFAQDTWQANDQLEVSLAVRIDNVEADFIDAQKPGTEIEETLVSPRLDTRFQHNDQWTSRFSIGQGYRAPLSFFETDHGILDAGIGFEIEVDRLERSLSSTYALSYAGDRLSATGTLAWTEVENLAALDETPAGVPLMTQRDETGAVWGATLDIGYLVTDDLDVSLTLEAFRQDEVMRSIFGVAPVEERIILAGEWTPGNWVTSVSYSWQGARNLSDYGYEGWNDAGLTLAKTLEGDAHADLDIRAEYQWGENWAVYLGGRNLLDHTQVEDESPLFFDASGGYDVAYIYGDLRGREIYGGFRVEY